MTGARWWRRNRWGLGAFAVVFPLSLWLVFANGWFSYFGSRPSQPVAVDGNGPVTFGDAHFTLVSAEVLPDVGADAVPDDTVVLAAAFEVDPGAADADGRTTLCTVTLAQADGGGAWRVLNTGDFGWHPSDPDAATGCDSERITPYMVETAFHIPSAALDRDLVLRLEVASELPRYLSFTLDAQ